MYNKMTRAKSPPYDQVFWVRTEEEIDPDFIPIERIRRMHIGRRTLLVKGDMSTKDGKYLAGYRDNVQLCLGNDSPKYQLEIRNFGTDERGVIITKLERLT